MTVRAKTRQRRSTKRGAWVDLSIGEQGERPAKREHHSEHPKRHSSAAKK
jgi:hypothetical protein